MKTPAVSIRNLEFSYGPKESILSIDQFDIMEGEKVFVYGPSGCGKTTLLGLIAGILRFQKGRISVCGEDLSLMSSSELDRFRGVNIGYIFQMFNLLPYLNVRDNIALPCKMNSERRKNLSSDIEAAISDLTKSLGIYDLLAKQVTNLSVGQQQRVAAARSLLGNPKLIIADEPTSALDVEHRQAFLSSLLDQANRLTSTVVFVSHDRSLASAFDRMVSIPELNVARRGEV